MTDQKTMDPAEFAHRLDASFGVEPPHREVVSDLHLGRRRLRRRRATVALSGLAAAVVVSGAATLVPGLVQDPGEQGAVAAGGTVSAEEIVATCMRRENVSAYAPWNASEEKALELLGEPRLMTSSVTDSRGEATLLSEDGTRWGECQFARRPDNGVKNAMSIYPTDVSFPERRVGGIDAYEHANEADPRLAGTATPPVPQFQTPCVSVLQGSARDEFDAKCPEFTMFWNDRRPAEVAAVRVVTPDGVSTWADVRRGYVSFAYTAAMTPEIAEQVREGERPGALRVVFYDSAGGVLVDDRDPGHVPGEGELSIQSFPSLAWWTKESRP